MLVRGFVETIVDTTHVTVRVPRINKLEGAVGATPSSELATAIISSPPGCSPRLRPGDAVIIGYENDDESSPIVIGMLFNQQSKTTSDVKCDSLDVKVDTNLPKNTSIGNVSRESIQNLAGLKSNAQQQLDKLDLVSSKTQSKLKEQTEETSKLKSSVEEVTKTMDDMKETVEGNSSSIKILNEGTYKFAKIAYGTAAPETITNAVEGQVYLYIQ